jgi:hypothetical protein
MPTGNDYMNFLYVNLGFIVQVCIMFYFVSIVEIRKNWPLYRCNPMYMPLSEDINSDFVQCIQNMQTDYVGLLLEPITSLVSSIADIGAEMSTNIQSSRFEIGNIRGFITNIVNGIFGVFINLILEFTKLIFSIKDMIAKFMGIIATLLFVMDGSFKTMSSLWGGLPGQTIRAAGACFHPDTLITLKDKSTCLMKNIKVGDILLSGAEVTATMQIKNTEPLFSIKTEKHETIYVTGSHKILFNKQFISVKDYPLAILEPTIHCSFYCCLITSTHTIQIDNIIFWDWEDWRLLSNNILL